MSDGERETVDPYRNRAVYHQWYTIEVSKKRHTDLLQFDVVFEVKVYAMNPSDAMKRCRKEFKDWYLRVL